MSKEEIYAVQTDGQQAIKTHTLFLQFSCGHEYFDNPIPGGVSDWDNCLCDSCQPYDAIIVVNHLCRHCGGSFNYFKDAPQIKLSQEEAVRRIEQSSPLFPESYGHIVKGPSVSMS